MTDFVHLHVHTHYSLLDSTVKVPALVGAVADAGMCAVAVTDHGNLFHCIELQLAAKEKGIQAIFGCSIYLVPDDAEAGRARPFQLVLLAETLDGYRNLLRLNSRAWRNGPDRAGRPLSSWADLAEFSGGLIALAGDLGSEVTQALLRRDDDRATSIVRRLVAVFGPRNVFLELQRLEGIPESRAACDMLVALGQELGVPVVATNNVHYLRDEEREAHGVLVCIGLDKRIDRAALDRVPLRGLHLRTPAEMAELFADLPEAIAATREIADRCKVVIPTGKPMLPSFPVPEGHDEASWIRAESHAGLEARFAQARRAGRSVDEAAYRERLDFELACIIDMKFAGYFLIVADFIGWAKEHGVPVGPGRGSGAGSLVAYALQITDIDPIPYGLLFERFLNPERVSMPDFDIDFCQERRGEVIEYVAQRYGRDNVGMIVTFGQLKAKAVVRDVARVLNLPFAEADRIAKLIPNELNIKLSEAAEKEPRLRELIDANPDIAWLYRIGLALEGNNRGTGMHAAGVVISDGALWEHVPVMTGGSGELIAQYAKNEVEKAGLVKFDFLGLKTLTVIEDAVRLVNRQRPADDPLDWDRIDLNDPAVYSLISSGDTTGVFQCESEGFQKLMRRLKPDCFEDIVAAVALYRPGPLGSGMIEQFIDCKHRRRDPDYPHPRTEPILRETYGVMVYQEQVMQVAQVLAGYSLGGADLLRRAMGKKNPAEMEKERGKFVEGAAKIDISAQRAGEIFDLMAHFAGYGFNKSHSAAYALLTFRTAWLKAHHPPEFLAAMMTNDASSTSKVARLITDARDRGVAVLPPDVNASEATFTVADGAIRFGLGAVRGIGGGAIDAIVEARSERRISSLFDFCERVDTRRCSKRVIEALVRCGAFDAATDSGDGAPPNMLQIGRRRARLEASIEMAVERGQRAQRDAEAGQSTLFDLLGSTPAVTDVLTDASAWDARTVLAYEREALGFYVSGHPLDRYEAEARRLADTTSATLDERRDRAQVRIAAVIASKRERLTRDGKGRIVNVQLEDRFGAIEGVVFPRSWEACAAGLELSDPVLVTGRVQVEVIDDSEQRRIAIEGIESLTDARLSSVRAVDIELGTWTVTPPLLDRLAATLAEHPGGCRVRLILSDGVSTAKVDLPDSVGVVPTDALISAIADAIGDDVVRLR